MVFCLICDYSNSPIYFTRQLPLRFPRSCQPGKGFFPPQRTGRRYAGKGGPSFPGQEIV